MDALPCVGLKCELTFLLFLVAVALVLGSLLFGLAER